MVNIWKCCMTALWSRHLLTHSIYSHISHKIYERTLLANNLYQVYLGQEKDFFTTRIFQYNQYSVRTLVNVCRFVTQTANGHTQQDLMHLIIKWYNNHVLCYLTALPLFSHFWHAHCCPLIVVVSPSRCTALRNSMQPASFLPPPVLCITSSRWHRHFQQFVGRRVWQGRITCVGNRLSCSHSMFPHSSTANNGYKQTT